MSTNILIFKLHISEFVGTFMAINSKKKNTNSIVITFSNILLIRLGMNLQLNKKLRCYNYCGRFQISPFLIKTKNQFNIFLNL